MQVVQSTPIRNGSIYFQHSVIRMKTEYFTLSSVSHSLFTILLFSFRSLPPSTSYLNRFQRFLSFFYIFINYKSNPSSWYLICYSWKYHWQVFFSASSMSIYSWSPNYSIYIFYEDSINRMLKELSLPLALRENISKLWVNFR